VHIEYSCIHCQIYISINYYCNKSEPLQCSPFRCSVALCGSAAVCAAVRAAVCDSCVAVLGNVAACVYGNAAVCGSMSGIVCGSARRVVCVCSCLIGTLGRVY
jgi:hypothetical protein